MESSRQTPGHLLDIQSQLIAREPLFHRPEFGISRDDFSAMITDDFWEIGASGRQYDQTFILDTLEARYATEYVDEWATENFYCQELAEDTYLLTYTLRQGERLSRRSTIWQWRPNRWVACFHQGTLVSSS